MFRIRSTLLTAAILFAVILPSFAQADNNNDPQNAGQLQFSERGVLSLNQADDPADWLKFRPNSHGTVCLELECSQESSPSIRWTVYRDIRVRNEDIVRSGELARGDDDSPEFQVANQDHYLKIQRLDGPAGNNYYAVTAYFWLPEIEADPNPLSFEIVGVHQDENTFTLSNDGPGLLQISSWRGPGEGVFTIFDEDGNQLPQQIDIAARHSIEVLVRFNPNRVGEFNGQLEFENNDDDRTPYRVNLHGLVNPANRAPVLASIGEKQIDEGRQLAFDVSAEDPDGDQLTYTAENLPNGAEFNGRHFAWTPGFEQAGQYQVTFRVSDGRLDDSETITISVGNANRAPVLASIGEKQIDEGRQLAFDVSAEDPDGGQLTYTAENLPNGAEFNGRHFAWTPGFEQAGQYQVTFRVSDGLASDEETVVTVVNDANHPQHFSDFTRTNANQSIIVREAFYDETPLISGWEVGVFTPGIILAGAGGWIEGEMLGMAAWADDPNTDEIEGFTEGQEFCFKLWDPETESEHNAEASFHEGPRVWTLNELTQLTLVGSNQREITINLTVGWNLISINVIPHQEYWRREEGPDVVRMTEQFRVDPDDNQSASHIRLMKDEDGNFYAPSIPFNNISYWDLSEGYLVKVDENLAATWVGQPIAAGGDILMTTGWNLTAYYPTYDLPCSRPNFYAINNILEHVILAKDSFGNFAAPRIPFSNMAPWTEGQGYQIKVDQDITFNYPGQLQRSPGLREHVPENLGKTRWIKPESSGSNMSVLIDDFANSEAVNGDQVAAFSTSGRLVGVGTIQNGLCGLAVWGDDISTEEIDGLSSTEAYQLQLWNRELDMVSDLRLLSVVTGSGLSYEKDGFTILGMGPAPIIPSKFYLGQNYPNPFNAVTKLEYGLPSDSDIRISVFDVSGRLVKVLVEGNQSAGTYGTMWEDPKGISGVYLIKMEAGNYVMTRKLILLK